jgi:hypothetical protein
MDMLKSGGAAAAGAGAGVFELSFTQVLAPAGAAGAEPAAADDGGFVDEATGAVAVVDAGARAIGPPALVVIGDISGGADIDGDTTTNIPL